jgi:hypothetical protein
LRTPALSVCTQQIRSVEKSSNNFMPRPPELDDDDDAAAAGSSAASKARKAASKSKERMQAAYKQAREQQLLRIGECKKANEERGRGKVSV